jgi:hypothetical protein
MEMSSERVMLVHPLESLLLTMICDMLVSAVANTCTMLIKVTYT